MLRTVVILLSLGLAGCAKNYPNVTIAKEKNYENGCAFLVYVKNNYNFDIEGSRWHIAFLDAGGTIISRTKGLMSNHIFQSKSTKGIRIGAPDVSCDQIHDLKIYNISFQTPGGALFRGFDKYEVKWTAQ